MKLASNKSSIFQQSACITSYTASLFSLCVVVVGVISAVYSYLFGQTADLRRMSNLFNDVVFVLVIPFVWIVTYAIAFAPALLVVSANRLLQQQLISDRIRRGVIYVLAIGVSLPISAGVWSLSFDGWTFVWPAVITVTVTVACRELLTGAIRACEVRRVRSYS
jgi:hypothetical protein